ncbi:hypothetical protein [Roseovarius arcticus]|uniref:hypothetical protein n=1 Tax=Roseovarius arcticus TaxID=2547404 RepID=UPI001110C207|nr:hypothetical protein [Roseovarius arcticus]
MLTDSAKTLITIFTAAGCPAVSPKGTFPVLGDATTSFGNIRAPGILATIEHTQPREIYP